MAGRGLMAKNKKSSDTFTPVVVIWRDAAMSTDPHWLENDRPDKPKGKAMHVCATVGWLVHCDDQWVQVVASVTEGQHAHVTEIPRQMVNEIIVLADSGSRI